MMNTHEQNIRSTLKKARRIVVKVGTRVLVDKNGRPNQRRIDALASDMAALQKAGKEVALVTSGAVGAGVEALGMKTRPKMLPEIQMAAAVGQARLMARYEKPFAAQKCQIGQVLLTYDDLTNRERHLNIRNTVNALFRHRIIPIINENDVVSVNEIKVGDNDVLAALSAIMIHADILILLSTTNGVRKTLPSGRTRLISCLTGIDDTVMQHVSGKGSHLSTGGMETKLLAAGKAVGAGITTLIADGRRSGILAELFSGRKTGTILPAADWEDGPLPSRKRWLAYFHRATGTIVVDPGARAALEHRGTSLLPIGIKAVCGRFSVGAAVNIKDTDGTLFARGLTEFASDDVEKIKGHKTSEMLGILGRHDYDEVIHRDNMVILTNGENQ
jgi:glutamate 5-kinase